MVGCRVTNVTAVPPLLISGRSPPASVPAEMSQQEEMESICCVHFLHTLGAFQHLLEVAWRSVERVRFVTDNEVGRGTVAQPQGRGWESVR
jgi:hypothetical protein